MTKRENGTCYLCKYKSKSSWNFGWLQSSNDQHRAVEDACVLFLKTWVHLNRKRPRRAQSSGCNCPACFPSRAAELHVPSRVDQAFQSLCFQEHFRTLPLTHQSWFCTWQTADILLGASTCIPPSPCSLVSRQSHTNLPACAAICPTCLTKVQSKAN